MILSNILSISQKNIQWFQNLRCEAKNIQFSNIKNRSNRIFLSYTQFFKILSGFRIRTFMPHALHTECENRTPPFHFIATYVVEGDSFMSASCTKKISLIEWTIHECSKYSLCTFIVFSGYLLTTDTEKRPDIYQCSYLAFKLNDSTEKCPVQNLNKAKKPSFDDISLGKTFWKKIKLKPIKNVYFLDFLHTLF